MLKIAKAIFLASFSIAAATVPAASSQTVHPYVELSRVEAPASIPFNLWNGAAGSITPSEQPPDEVALVLSCTVSLMSGDLRSAERICDQASLLQPEDPTPYKLSGFAYLMDGRYEQAHYDFKRAVRLTPKDAADQFGLAEVLRDQGDFLGAIRRFAVAIKLMPEDAIIWNGRCWTRGVFDKQLRLGLRDCNIALTLDPGNALVLDSRGLVDLRLGRIHDAIEDYSASIAKLSDLPTALYGRGVAELRSGDLAGASHDLEWARALDARVDDNFAESPLLPPACRSALAIASLRTSCEQHVRPRPRTPPTPLAGKSAMRQSHAIVPKHSG